MADELRFIDPAFSCEVVLRGVGKSLYEAGREQFERLRDLRSLGLSGHFEDAGFHTRHHHLIGLFRLFEKLLVQPKGLGLPKEFLWSFWCRLCYGQVGHAPFGYEAEKAVLLACHVDASFRNSFMQFLQPVITETAKCDLDVPEIERKAKVEAWLNKMIDENMWNRVHLWIAALKLIQNDRILGILNNQKYDSRSGKPGFDWCGALRILLDPESEWDKPVRMLNRLDFVVRDLSFTGRVGVTLDIDRLVSAANNLQDPDWRLVDSMYHYLTETLYASTRRQTEATIFQRTLVTLLLSDKLKLERLFGIETDDYLSDEDVRATLCQYKQGRELFNQEIRSSWCTWKVRAILDKELPPLELQRRLAGKRTKSTILDDPTRKRIICYKMLQPHTVAVAIRHSHSADRPDPSEFVKTCKRLLDTLFPSVNAVDVHHALFEGLCGQQIRHGLQDVVDKLSKVEPTDPAILKKVVRLIGKKNTPPSSVGEQVKLVIAGIEWPIAPMNPENLFLKVAEAALVGSEDTRKTLGLDLGDALEILWRQMLFWQDRHFVPKPPQAVEELVSETQNKLMERIRDNESTRASDLEIYAFLESLRKPADNVKFRLSVPNYVVIADRGNTTNEYDVVSIILKAYSTVEVWVWGVTTEDNIEAKRRDDLAKMNRLRDLLGNRWGGEIRTVSNYVHIEDNAICLDIDGRQERRRL